MLHTSKQKYAKKEAWFKEYKKRHGQHQTFENAHHCTPAKCYKMHQQIQDFSEFKIFETLHQGLEFMKQKC